MCCAHTHTRQKPCTQTDQKSGIMHTVLNEFSSFLINYQHTHIIIISAMRGASKKGWGAGESTSRHPWETTRKNLKVRGKPQHVYQLRYVCNANKLWCYFHNHMTCCVCMISARMLDFITVIVTIYESTHAYAHTYALLKHTHNNTCTAFMYIR